RSGRRSGTARDRRRNRASTAGRRRSARQAMSDDRPHAIVRPYESQDSALTSRSPFRLSPLSRTAPEPHVNQANKKPGLNLGSAGITCVPGLFSDFFNVAASRPAQMTTERRKPSPPPAFRQAEHRVNRAPAHP